MGTVWNIAHQVRAKLMAVSGHERLRTEATRHHIRNVVSAHFFNARLADRPHCGAGATLRTVLWSIT
jgi:hypothetical protein